MNNILVPMAYLCGVLCLGSIFRKAGKQNRARNKWALVAIFLVCLFAALRSESVGTDTHTYIYRYNIARGMDYIQYMTIYWEGRSFLFVWFTQLVSRLTNSNIGLYLFLLQLITILPIYLTCWKFRERVNLEVAMGVYLLLYFPASLNIMRECVSAAIMLYAWAQYKDRKFLFSAVLALISYGFHDTSLFFLIIFAIIEIGTHGNRSRWKTLFIGIFSVAFFIVITDFGGLLTEFFFNLPLFENNKIVVYYERLQAGSYMLEIGRFGILDAVFRVLFFIVPVVLIKERKNELFLGLRVYAFVDLLIYLGVFFSLHTTYGYRVAFYFDLFNILYFSIDYTRTKVNGVLVRNALLIGLSILYFLVIFVMIGANNIFPYEFRIG